MQIPQVAANAAFCLALFIAPLAPAATLDVCPASCTYADIQSAVDAAAPGDVIDIAAGTYAGDVDVSVSGLEFRGASAGNTVVEGLGAASFIFRADSSPVTVQDMTLMSPFQMSCVYNYGADVTIRDTVIEDCGATQVISTAFIGGAVYTTGDLLLERVTLSGNTANVSTTVPGLGGAIYIVGDPAGDGPVVRIVDSELSFNTALQGGAIYAEEGSRLFIDGTLVSDNIAEMPGPSDGQGGGVWTSGELFVTNSTFSNNYADSNGGGIAIYDGGNDVHIAASEFAGNVTFQGSAIIPLNAGGAIYVESSGTVRIIGSELSGNVSSNGGAIGAYNLLTGGSIKVNTSAIVSNAAAYGGGGGMYVAGGSPVTLNTVTVADNTTEFYGLGGPGGGLTGGLGADYVIKNSTITGNTAEATGGGLGGALVSFEIENSILAGNTALTAGATGSTDDCDGTVASNGDNLVGTEGGCGVVAVVNDLIGTDPSPVDAMLLALGDHGGATSSMPPDPSSPAVDAGAAACPPYDQRGYARPVDGGSGIVQCDRGAVELAGVCGSPQRPTLLEPATGAIDVATSPLLVWQPAVHALTYDVVLATQPPPFASGIVATRTGLTATHWKPDVALAAATTYYWRVRTISACGNRKLSAVWSFTTQ